MWGPEPENKFIRDRIQLCDGLTPLYAPRLAVHGNGRLVFLLGDKKTEMVSNGNETVYFTLDCIDLFLSSRTRIERMGGFDDFGWLVGFYSIDERTVVIVDYNETDSTHRQRLIEVDIDTNTADCVLYRTTRFNAPAIWLISRTVVSEESAVTVVPRSDSGMSVLVFPVNPLNTTKSVDITTTLIRALADFRLTHSSLSISMWDPPFFVSPHRLAFFIEPPNDSADAIDPNLVFILDIRTGTFVLQSLIPDSSTQFPQSVNGQTLLDNRIFQTSTKEVGLLASFRVPPTAFVSYFANIFERLSQYAFHIFLKAVTAGWINTGIFFLKFSIQLSIVKIALITPPGCRFGVLCTRTMRWTEQPFVVNDAELCTVKGGIFPDGHALFYDTSDREYKGMRSIGSVDPATVNHDLEQLRIVRPAICPSSLKSIASIGVQRLSDVDLRLKKILADRI